MYASIQRPELSHLKWDTIILTDYFGFDDQINLH
jgi:hypothetical protein